MSSAYLCGRDPLSGQDYEHRRGWIQQRLELAAEAASRERRWLQGVSHTRTVFA